jgi:hypothetical protein
MAPKRRPNSDQVGGGLAGATGGTSFLALASLFPEGSTFKQIAQFVAPTLTVVLSIAWAFALNRLQVYFADKQLEAELKKAEEEYKKTVSDPGIAQKTKDEMQKRVEALRLLKFNVHTDRVETIVNA